MTDFAHIAAEQMDKALFARFGLPLTSSRLGCQLEQLADEAGLASQICMFVMLTATLFSLPASAGRIALASPPMILLTYLRHLSTKSCWKG